MKVEKTKNRALIEIEREHTHIVLFSDTKESNKPFKDVHITTQSFFPKEYQGIRIDTFDDGSFYIEIPKNIVIHIRLENQSSEQKEAEQ